jgi:SnoaL-like domain
VTGAVPSGTDLSRVAVEAMRLQNAYALAIDARDWELFRTVFTQDVRADYPHAVFDGMDAWLANFIPFHGTCAWTVHEITNHVVGEDAQGIWATCYGWIRWTMKDRPGRINRAEVLFRDRLQGDSGTWRIARRKLRMLSAQPDVPVADGLNLLQSVLELSDWT